MISSYLLVYQCCNRSVQRHTCKSSCGKLAAFQYRDLKCFDIRSRVSIVTNKDSLRDVPSLVSPPSKVTFAQRIPRPPIECAIHTFQSAVSPALMPISPLLTTNHSIVLRFVSGLGSCKGPSGMTTCSASWRSLTPRLGLWCPC